MTTRIYRITDKQNTVRLIEATSIAAALRHVAEPLYDIDVPSAKTVAAAMTTGVKVEQAKALQVAGEAA